MKGCGLVTGSRFLVVVVLPVLCCLWAHWRLRVCRFRACVSTADDAVRLGLYVPMFVLSVILHRTVFSGFRCGDWTRHVQARLFGICGGWRLAGKVGCFAVFNTHSCSTACGVPHQHTQPAGTHWRRGRTKTHQSNHLNASAPDLFGICGRSRWLKVSLGEVAGLECWWSVC